MREKATNSSPKRSCSLECVPGGRSLTSSFDSSSQSISSCVLDRLNGGTNEVPDEDVAEPAVGGDVDLRFLSVPVPESPLPAFLPVCPDFPEFLGECPDKGPDDLALADEAELMEDRVETVETGERVLIRVVRMPPPAPPEPDPPDKELRPLSLLL